MLYLDKLLLRKFTLNYQGLEIVTAAIDFFLAESPKTNLRTAVLTG